MRIITLFIPALFLFSLFISCNGPAEGVFVLDCASFDSTLKQTENPQLIDVRTPQEFEGGTIYEALNIDYNGEDFKAAMNQFDKKRPIFLFCAKGGRSGNASKIGKNLGFETIYDLERGYTAWKAYVE
jgi:rhodanese-related sulfurtransferase